MRPFISRLAPAVLTLAALMVPAVASAVTVDEIVALTRAGVTDTVILALIDRDKTIFTLEPDQLVRLQSDGVSEAVILAMLKSGREEGERAAQAASDLQTAMYLAERSSGPEVLVPEPGPAAAPGGYVTGGYFGVPYYAGARRGRARPHAPTFTPYVTSPSPTIVAPATIPVVPPSNIPVIPPVSRIRTQASPAPQPMLCRADVRGANSAFPLTTIVECPAVMQRAR